MKCRHCQNPLTHDFADLGSAPPSNSYLSREKLAGPETWYPLKVMVCERCWLVQTEDFAERETFFSEDYAYFSSMSSSWLKHATRYADDMITRFGIGPDTHVVEIASNDGYLLRNFRDRNIPCLGIEPTEACAKAAREIGIETITEFFGVDLAQKLVNEGKSADLTAANNVLAHVPDINDFVSGFAILLKEQGVATFEFPHLLNLVQYNQFDTIYHEHYSYLSITALETVFRANGLSIFDVEKLDTHGGSLRLFAQRHDSGTHQVTDQPALIMEAEKVAGMESLDYYSGFQAKADKVKDNFLQFLLNAKKEGKSVAAYGAAAKGNTLLNFAGVRPDLVSFVVDKSPLKEGRYMPGSRIPIVQERLIKEHQPDYVIILPWNLEREISSQLDYIRSWAGKIVVAVPELRIW